MQRLIIISFPLLLLSCGGDKEEEGSMDFEDFAGDYGTEDVDSSNGSFEIEEEKLFSMNMLIKSMSQSYDTVTSKTNHPMDRFSFSTRRKIQFIGKEEVPYGKSNMVTPKAEFFYYSFVDSNKTVNAFYNYLDMMADEGEGGPVKLNENVESIKSPPLFMVVYDTIIVSAEYLCEHEENDWNSFQDSIIKIYGKDYKYQIDVDCGGPLKWK